MSKVEVDMRGFYSIVRSAMSKVLTKYDLTFKKLDDEYKALQNIPNELYASTGDVYARSRKSSQMLDRIMSEEDRTLIRKELASIAFVSSEIKFKKGLEQFVVKLGEMRRQNREEYTRLFNRKKYIMNDYVNAFSVSAITKPIKSIRDFYKFLISECYHELDEFAIARVIGLAIKYDVEYFKNHVDAEIDDIDTLNKLDRFINQFGSRIKFDDSDSDELEIEFIDLVYLLLEGDKTIDERFKENQIDALEIVAQVASIGAAMSENFDLDHMYARIVESPPKVVKPETPIVKRTPVAGEKLSEEEIRFRQELNRCYKNGEVIGLPNCVLVDFETAASQFLDSKGASYVIRSLKTMYKNMPLIQRYMTPDDREVYTRAISEKTKLRESQSSEFDELMQFLNELAEVYKGGISAEEKAEYDKELADCVGNIELLFQSCGVFLRDNTVSKRASNYSA